MRSDAIKVLIHYSSMQVYKNNVHQTQGAFAQIKYLSLRNVSQIFKPVMEIVQITSNTLFSFPIGTYNFHDDTAVVRNLQDVTNSSAHHNPRRTRIIKTI